MTTGKMGRQVVDVDLSGLTGGADTYYQSTSAQLGGVGTRTEIYGVELDKPATRGMEVVVSGHVADSTGAGTTYQNAFVEVAVIVWRGPHKEEVFVGALGGAVGELSWNTSEPMRATRVSVEARGVIDGGSGNYAAAPEAFYASATISLFR